MRACDFHGTRPKFWVRIHIRNNRDQTTRQRQAYHFPNNRGVALILWVHRNGAVTQHGFRPRGGNGNIIPLFLKDDIAVLIFFDIVVSFAAFERIFKVPEMTIFFDILDLEIRNRRLEMGVPIDQSFVAVNQASFIHIDKGLGDGVSHLPAFTTPQGKAGARPIT